MGLALVLAWYWFWVSALWCGGLPPLQADCIINRCPGSMLAFTTIYSALLVCPEHRRVRINSFSVHHLGNTHRNKKAPCTLTPSLSTEETLRLQLNVQGVVGNPTLLLWLTRRDAMPSVRSSKTPILLLTPLIIIRSEPGALPWLCNCGVCVRLEALRGCVACILKTRKPISVMFQSIARLTN